MKKMLASLYLFAAVMFSGAADVPVLLPVKAEIPPVIDGKLDDLVWKSAQSYTGLKVAGGKEPSRPTSFQLAYTDTALILGVKVFIKPSELPSEADVRKEYSVYHTECIEIMLDPAGTGDTYTHLLVNSIGRRSFSWREQNGYVSSKLRHLEWQTAVHRDKDFWSAEIRIPYYSLNLFPNQIRKPGAKWLFNLVRNAYNLPDVKLEYSSLANGLVHSPGNYVYIDAPPPAGSPEVDLSPYLWTVNPAESKLLLLDGRSVMKTKLKVKNQTGAERQIVVSQSFRPKDGTMLPEQRAELTVPADGEVVCAMPDQQLTASGKYEVTVSLRDRQSNRLLNRRYFDREVILIPLAVKLEDPHYRNAIFATQKLDKVRYTLQFKGEAGSGWKMVSGIRLAGGKELTRESRALAAENRFEFPAGPLPEERMEIYAQVTDGSGKVRFSCTEPLRKLPYRKNEVWRGKDGIWRVDGKKTFILASWGSCDVSFLPDYNIVVPDGLGRNGKGMRINRATIFGIGKIRRQLREKGATDEVKEQYRQIVRRTKDDPTLFAHYLCDEPDCFGFTVERLEAVGKIIADEDPYHPLLISTTSRGGTAYGKCAELNGMHVYPRPIQGKTMCGFERIVMHMDRITNLFRTAGIPQDVVFLHQGFNYGDCGVSVSNRVPSYEEYRNQNLMVLILGAKGLFQYNRTEETYPELYLGLPELIREQKLVGEQAIIQNPSDVSPESSVPSVRMLARKTDGGHYWLLACNMSHDTVDAKIRFAPFGSGKFMVLSEDRTVEGAEITEHFTPFQVHVYTNQPDLPTLKPVKQINEEIERVYAARKKPGNLVYQRNEQEVLKVTASSNRADSRRKDAALWHLTDGVTEGRPAKAHGGGVIVYCDKTPGEWPDWVQYDFRTPVTVGRVEIFPVANSVKDYELQVWDGAKFVTVHRASNVSGKKLTASFEPVRTEKLRLVVTAGRGKNTMLYEMDVYEK